MVYIDESGFAHDMPTSHVVKQLNWLNSLNFLNTDRNLNPKFILGNAYENEMNLKCLKKRKLPFI